MLRSCQVAFSVRIIEFAGMSWKLSSSSHISGDEGTFFVDGALPRF